ncbi:hypothetical protein F2Q70_00027639, partial [Brassica cretica]
CPLGSAAGSSSRRREEILAGFITVNIGIVVLGKGVISLDSDSEDTPGAETSYKYGPISLEHPCRLEPLTSDSDSGEESFYPFSQSSLPKVAVEVDSDQEIEDASVEKMSRRKQASGSKSPSLSGNALPRKRLSKDERIRAAEEKKLRKEQEKLQRAASRAEEAEKRKLDKEMEKRGKGKLALKSIVAEIDLQLVEGALGAPLITLFAEKGITYRVISNPIKSSIVWTMTTLPEDVSQVRYSRIVVLRTLELATFINTPNLVSILVSCEALVKRPFIVQRALFCVSVPGKWAFIFFCFLIRVFFSLLQKIPYVLLVYEAEEFCNLVANERLLENVSRVREQYPSYTVCYLTNKLISYVEKREKKDYNVGKSNGWNRPPIDEVLAKLTTHYDRVHSRHCIDGPEVAAHVVGLTSSLASCHFRY